MVKFMQFEENYFEICKEQRYKTIIYGAGAYGKRALPYLKNVVYVCDKKADNNMNIKGIPVIHPENLKNIKEKFLLVICIKSASVREEVRKELQKLPIDALVFDYFNNIAFDMYRDEPSNKKKTTLQYVNIINPDNGWILSKFAVKMKEELERKGYKCTINSAVDPLADINHHVIYDSADLVVPYLETFMITHIDSYKKLERLKWQLTRAGMGICMSRETMNKLSAYGIPRAKLCYINPAQDNEIKPKKYVLGITSKTHDDNRKKEDVLIALCSVIDHEYFSFQIMGSGWDNIVAEVRKMGFDVTYFREFDYEQYTKLMSSLDYYLYWGFDEGSMGFLDALRAGIGTIVTPQGYHLDVKDGITYACRTVDDFKNALLELQDKRKNRIKSIESWNWENFVNKHIEIWNYLLGNTEDLFINQHLYEDGIFSVLRENA